jgi:hypothetical protein
MSIQNIDTRKLSADVQKKEKLIGRVEKQLKQSIIKKIKLSA